MNKKIRNLIIGAVVLVLLVGVLLLLLFLPQQSSEPEESSVSETSVTSSTVELFSRETTEIDTITLENEAGVVTVKQEAESTYQVQGLEDIEQNANASSLMSARTT